MGWGSLISAGISLFAGSRSSGAAGDANALAMAELEFDREQAAIMNALREQILQYLPGAFDKQNELYDQILDQNITNRNLSLNQLNYSRDFTERNFDALGQEQDFEKYRITQADRLGAEERSRQLQQLIDDQATTKAERELALQELDYARSIAANERDYDIKSYEADQLKSQLEYQYRIQQYEQAVGTANEERQFEIDRQEKILKTAGIMKSVIDEQIAGFGPLGMPERFNSDDVSDYSDEFYEAYRGDADRAADRLGSVNEAALIRRGVDSSTTGANSRAGLLRDQLVPLYNTARVSARQQALGHVQGLQSNAIAGFNAEVGARASSIDEALRGNAGLLAAMERLGVPQSANINDYLQLGTGVTGPRNIASANNFGAPVPINTSVFSQNLDTGLDPTRGLDTSRARLNPSTNDGTFNMQIPDFFSPQDIFSNATGVPTRRSNFPYLANAAGDAGANATELFMTGINQFASAIDEFGN